LAGPEVTLEIVRADGEILPPGEIGQIRPRKRPCPGGMWPNGGPPSRRSRVAAQRRAASVPRTQRRRHDS
jgi:hypothetical protein